MQSRPPLWKRLAPDLGGLAVLAVTALAIGLAINHWRAKPLPLVYHTKAERLENAVETISKQAPTNAPTNAVSQPALSQISLDELKRRSAATNSVILDARAEFFYQLGHVPGALSLPRSDFEAAYAKLKTRLEADKNQPIAVYCSGSDCEDSQMVAEALVKLGFRKVAVFKGGWDDWTAAHLPEEKSQ